MPHELSLPRWNPAWIEHVPQPWRWPLAQLALAWTGLFLLTRSDWAEMARQWWNSSTCNHVLLVPPILAWLVCLRWPELRKLRPEAWWPPLAWFAAGLLAWGLGTLAGVNLVAELGVVMLLQAAVGVILGPKAGAGLLFPLAYMIFLVPFGDEIMPPLQAITAHIAVALTHASGVPATISGVFIDTPVGRFEVAQACSGVKFLIAMIALGTLVAHLCFRSNKRRTLFMAACVVVPILANGVRAWGTIYVAQSRGIAFAAGFDHIVYGWVFFAIVMAVLLGFSWRFFDRPTHDPLIDARAIEASPGLSRLAQKRIGGWSAVAAMLLMALATSWSVALAGPFVEGSLAALGVRP
ncbi:MAG TPA: exosortase A [Croceibacterium sp.]|jgi:exosortase A